MRVLAWFSCGSASAVAAKLAIEKYGSAVEVLYCDTLAYEHPDNARFMRDVSKWLGKEITILRSEKFTDIFDVFRKRRFIVGPRGAPCTTELKKRVRFKYQRPDDRHVFGLTAEECDRADRMREQGVEDFEFPLIDAGITKRRCHEIIGAAGIEQPAMYRLGYNNNNCVGCVKGGMGYWNKIRRDFPESFERMAKVEREIGASILSMEDGRRLYLDELTPEHDEGQLEMSFECGVLCEEAK